MVNRVLVGVNIEGMGVVVVTVTSKDECFDSQGNTHAKDTL